MTWSYRIVSRRTDKEEFFEICEVYCNDQGAIVGWTEAISPIGDSLKELQRDMDYMMLAFQKPVLKEEILTQTVNAWKYKAENLGDLE